jgi:hypothetical protein
MSATGRLACAVLAGFLITALFLAIPRLWTLLWAFVWRILGV